MASRLTNHYSRGARGRDGEYRGMTSPIRKPFRTVGLVAAFSAAILAPVAPALAQSANQGPSLLRDTEIEEILHREADPIFVAAGLNPKDVRILLVGDSTLNAFATQGQQLGLNTGLILEAETPNQLKGVIAHETGHMFSMRHCTKYECLMSGTNHLNETDRRPIDACPE